MELQLTTLFLLYLTKPYHHIFGTTFRSRPEGQSCGLLNQKSLLSHITCGVSIEGIKLLTTFLLSHGIQAVTSGALRYRRKNTIVSICGDVVGFIPCEDTKTFVQKLRRLRSNHTIPIFVGIVHLKDMNEIHIQVQPGRLVRPIFHVPVVKKLLESKEPLVWDRWVEKGAIIYVDKAEEADMIVDGKVFDEITPSAIMSGTVAQIPFACRNQAPR